MSIANSTKTARPKKTVLVQARELFRAAKRLGVSVTTMSDANNNKPSIYLGKHRSTDPGNTTDYCARHILNRVHTDDWFGYNAIPNVIDEVGLSALEAGFENWEHQYYAKNRYYKVGQNFRKMVQAERERQERQAAKISTRG